MAVFWDVASCSMIELINDSETSVSLYQITQRNIPEDSHLRVHRRENLRSHYQINCLSFMNQ